MHVGLRAALLCAQRDHRADVLLRHEDLAGDDRLADFLDQSRVGRRAGFDTCSTLPSRSFTS